MPPGLLQGLFMWQNRGYKSKYLQLKKKLEDEFPGCLDICGEGTPQATGFFEVMVAGKLVHSKKKGDGYAESSDLGPAPVGRRFMTGRTEMSH
ncbi:Selenoprotein W [Manis javanica]|nr:Selenoprotein W [Manis javanica]